MKGLFIYFLFLDIFEDCICQLLELLELHTPYGWLPVGKITDVKAKKHGYKFPAHNVQNTKLYSQ